MGLNTDFKDFDASLTACLQAQYTTDLNIVEKEGMGKTISLRGYAYIPLLGRLISYFVYKFSKQSDVDAINSKLKGLVAEYQTKATNHVNALFTFPNPKFADQVKRVCDCYNKYASLYLNLHQKTTPSFQECAVNQLSLKISDADLKELNAVLRGPKGERKEVQWDSHCEELIAKVELVAEAIKTCQVTLKLSDFCKKLKDDCALLLLSYKNYQDEIHLRAEIRSLTDSLPRQTEQKGKGNSGDDLKATFNRLLSASSLSLYLDLTDDIKKLKEQFALCDLNRHLKAIGFNVESLAKFLDAVPSNFLLLQEKDKTHAQALSSMPVAVIEVHSQELSDKCQCYLTKVKHSNFYHSILKKENITDQLTSAFTPFFTALAEHPNEMRKVILFLPEKTDPEKAIKFQAFRFLLKPHYAKDGPRLDQLLPAGKDERAAFLISAFRLGMFERNPFPSFKKEAEPELIKLQAEKAPKVFSDLLDQIKAQIEKKYKSQVAMKVDKSSKNEKEAEDKKTQETLEAVWERIESLKAAAAQQTPPADLDSLMDYLTKQRDFLIQILALVPPPLLKEISLPCTKNLIWPAEKEAEISQSAPREYEIDPENKASSGEIDHNYTYLSEEFFHSCHRECEIHSALDDSLTLSIFIKLMKKDKKTLNSLESFYQFFKDLTLLDLRRAVELFTESSDFFDEEQLIDAVQILIDLYQKKDNVPFFDIPASTEKDRLLTVIFNLPSDNLINGENKEEIEIYFKMIRAFHDPKLRDCFLAKFFMSKHCGFIKDQKGISEMIDNLSQPHRDQVYQNNVLRNVNIQNALKIEDAKLRDAAIKFVFYQDVRWQSFDELYPFITKIADMEQFSPVFLDYIKMQIEQGVDLSFATLVAEYIADAKIQNVAKTLIQEAKK